MSYDNHENSFAYNVYNPYKNVPERKYFIINPENLIANGPKKDVDVYPLPLKHDLHLHYVVL